VDSENGLSEKTTTKPTVRGKSQHHNGEKGTTIDGGLGGFTANCQSLASKTKRQKGKKVTNLIR